MASNYNSFGGNSFKGSLGVGVDSSSSSPVEQYGRVIDVILDSTHPSFESLGRTQALYGVFYQPLYQGSAEVAGNESVRFAYCNRSNIRQIPIRGEIVLLGSRPAVDVSETELGGNANVYQTCWLSIVPVWNHPHLNIAPDTKALEGYADLGEEFQSDLNVGQLQLCAGDIAFEGRFGQSIRFGGAPHKGSPIVSPQENSGKKEGNKPYTIIRNGGTEPGVVFEDINKDGASIYLTDNHRVPLEESKRVFKTVKNSAEIPESAREYVGKQIVLNSDRLFLNARKDDIELAANTHVGVNADKISVDGEKYVSVDGKKIYLGSYSTGEANPVLKGSETIQLLEDTINILNNLIDALSRQQTNPTVWVRDVSSVAAPMAKSSLKSIQSRLNSLLSKKVFVE